MFRLTADQKVEGNLTYADAYGNPTTVEPGTVRIVSQDDTLLTIEQDPADENHFTATAVGPVTPSVQMTITADADRDLGPDEVREITGSETFEVVAGETNVVVVNLGEAQPKS